GAGGLAGGAQLRYPLRAHPAAAPDERPPCDGPCSQRDRRPGAADRGRGGRGDPQWGIGSRDTHHWMSSRLEYSPSPTVGYGEDDERCTSASRAGKPSFNREMEEPWSRW